MKEISIKELREKIANKETMLVSFSTDWCGPCKMLKEELKKVTTTTPIYRVNAEEDIYFSKEHNVRSVPTMKMFKEGSVVSTTVGVKMAQDINKLIMENV